MSIFEHAKHVITSNVGAVVSSLSEGQSPQKQHQAALVAALATEKSLRAQCEALGADVERWCKRAELAITAGDDVLAREALTKKQHVERQLADVTRCHGEASQTLAKMRSEAGNSQAIEAASVGTDADSVIARMEAKVAQQVAATRDLEGPRNEASRTPYSHVTTEPEPTTPPVRFRVK
jgi:phage shock protein A